MTAQDCKAAQDLRRALAGSELKGLGAGAERAEQHLSACQQRLSRCGQRLLVLCSSHRSRSHSDGRIDLPRLDKDKLIKLGNSGPVSVPANTNCAPVSTPAVVVVDS